MTEETLELERISCNTCKVPFWISKDHVERLRTNHETFYCPSGHSQWYPGVSDKSRIHNLRAELQTKENQLAAAQTQRDEAKRKAKSYKMHFARYKKKVGEK